MGSLTITYDQAARIKELLKLFIGPGPLTVQEGSMKIDDVTLDWNKDLILLSINKPVPKEHLKGG